MLETIESHAGHIIGCLLTVLFSYILREIRAVRKENREYASNLREYVHNEKCELHRALVEKKIAEGLAEVKKACTHCPYHNELIGQAVIG